MLSQRLVTRGVVLVGLLCLAGCSRADVEGDGDVFVYDENALPDAKPWTSEGFRNDPDNFRLSSSATVPALIDGHEHITMGPAGASWHHDGPGNVATSPG